MPLKQVKYYDPAVYLLFKRVTLAFAETQRALLSVWCNSGYYSRNCMVLHYGVALPSRMTRILYILPSLIYNSDHWDTSVYRAFLFIVSHCTSFSYSTETLCLQTFLILYTPFNKLSYFPSKHHQRFIPLHFLSSWSLLTRPKLVAPSPRITKWNCFFWSWFFLNLVQHFLMVHSLLLASLSSRASLVCFPCFSSSSLISPSQALGR